MQEWGDKLPKNATVVRLCSHSQSPGQNENLPERRGVFFFSCPKSKCNLTWKVKQNYLGGQKDLRHLTWVALLLSRIQMIVLIFGQSIPKNCTTEAVFASIAGALSLTGKVINGWRRMRPVSLPAPLLFFFFSLAGLHTVSPAITPVAARLHHNWPKPSRGLRARFRSELASHITCFAAPS